MRGLVNRLMAILDIGREATRLPLDAAHQHLALTLIIRVAERSASPTEAREDWRKR